MTVPRTSFVLAPLLFLSACHESSSNPQPSATTRTSNLGVVPLSDGFGTGRLRLIFVDEGESGFDFTGDGDTLDTVALVVDMNSDGAFSTGLAVDASVARGGASPEGIAVEGTVAFPASERATGARDRNGDGDADDFVLAVYDHDGRAQVPTPVTENLGLAVQRVLATATLVVCDVPELAQGAQDLNGDGDLEDTVPFVHDRHTRETWNTELRGARVLALGGELVALERLESEVGDRNGDGDTLDRVLEFYDVASRSLLRTTLPLSDRAPVPHRGSWAVYVDQGAAGEALFVLDPMSGEAHDLGRFRTPARALDLEPFVLFESGIETSSVWLYDRASERVENTGLHGLPVARAGRLLVNVSELVQDEDLDGNGHRDGIVAVFYDLNTGRKQSLGVDGSAEFFGDQLFLLTREELARRDWNGDGDQDDHVLQVQDRNTGRLLNTRLAALQAVELSDGHVVLLVDEESDGIDWNRDGDRLDQVVQDYDAFRRRITNLALATDGIRPSASSAVLYPVLESDQGGDLNGDGDLLDRVLYLTRTLFFARGQE